MHTVQPWDDRETVHRARRRTGWGLALVVAGLSFFADQWGWVDLSALTLGWFSEPYGLHFWLRIWPAVIVLAGLIRVFSATRAHHLTRGLAEAGIGLWLWACIEHWWGLTFASSWPLLLIIVGLRIVFGHAHVHYGDDARCHRSEVKS